MRVKLEYSERFLCNKANIKNQQKLLKKILRKGIKTM